MMQGSDDLQHKSCLQDTYDILLQLSQACRYRHHKALVEGNQQGSNVRECSFCQLYHPQVSDIELYQNSNIQHDKNLLDEKVLVLDSTFLVYNPDNLKPFYLLLCLQMYHLDSQLDLLFLMGSTDHTDTACLSPYQLGSVLMLH